MILLRAGTPQTMNNFQLFEPLNPELWDPFCLFCFDEVCEKYVKKILKVARIVILQLPKEMQHAWETRVNLLRRLPKLERRILLLAFQHIMNNNPPDVKYIKTRIMDIVERLEK